MTEAAIALGGAVDLPAGKRVGEPTRCAWNRPHMR